MSFERRDRREPVELLLRRIVDRALMGSLMTLGAACANDGARERTMEPASGVDAGFLVPVPLPPRDAAPDAPGESRADAASTPDASTDAATDADVVAELPADAFDPCSRGAGFPVRAEGLSLRTPADYVAVRLASGIQGAPDDAPAWTSTQFMRISERGEACATATSDACAQQVRSHPDSLEQSYCVQACVEWSVVTTRGDEVERWATPAELSTLLGPIDSDDDALMFAAASGYDVTCPAPGENTSGANLRYVRTTPEGRELVGLRHATTCPLVLRRVRLLVTAAGELRELASTDFASGDQACVGRVPAGLRAFTTQANGLPGYLARCAYLEAASVHAFERLADELARHGAPAALIERAREAAWDEVLHAHVVGELARARGGHVPTLRVDAIAARSLLEVACENAIEGCVRETYGALVGAWQAARAQDLELRHAMRAIAEDEARHAQLSHDVHAWLMTQLDAREREHVRQARDAAIARLQRECARPPHFPEAGLPNAAEAQVLLHALDRELWAA